MAQFKNQRIDLPKSKIAQIAKKFIELNRLDRPTKNYCLICPIGLIGSGKTTVIKKLARHFGLVRCSTDEMRAYLDKLGYNTQKAVDAIRKVTEILLKKKRGLAIDADCARPEIVKEFLSKPRIHKIPLVWIKIDVPEKIILARLSPDNKKRKYRGPEAIANYFKRKELHKNIDLPFVYVFKNETPEKLKVQMIEAKQKIKEFLKTCPTK